MFSTRAVDNLVELRVPNLVPPTFRGGGRGERGKLQNYRQIFCEMHAAVIAAKYFQTGNFHSGSLKVCKTSYKEGGLGVAVMYSTMVET